MKIIDYQQLERIFFSNNDNQAQVAAKEIVKNVRENGDEAVKYYTKKFVGIELDDFKVDKKEIVNSIKKLTISQIDAIEFAKANIQKFAKTQMNCFKDFEIETSKGVFCSQKLVAVKNVCVYVPGGNYPLVSSVLMGVIPAIVAGVKRVIITTPTDRYGKINPFILAAANICKVEEIYKIGGAQAVAAVAYGTKTIPRVDMIVGPGNRYVTSAKKEVFGQIGIDLFAGASEILVIADEFAKPNYIAADLLAQAEHDINSKSILLTTSQKVAELVNSQLKKQLKTLPTKEIAKKSIKKNGYIVVVPTIKKAVKISNKFAPEHLHLHMVNPPINSFKNYGSLFIGEDSCEALGDYCAGINHTLPTAGAARFSSGLSVKHFIKLQTSLRVESINEIATHSKIIAKIEGLSAHLNSIKQRLKK